MSDLLSALTDTYERLLIDPRTIVKDMTFDAFCDWVDLGSKEDLIACLKVFESSKMHVGYTSVIKFKIRQLTT